MRVIADISLAALNTQDLQVADYLAECVRILKEENIKTNLHACGINLEGEWAVVFSAVEKCHQALHEMGASDVQANLRLNTQVGFDQTMEDSVKKVKKSLKKEARVTTGNYQPAPTKSQYCEVKKSSIHNLGVYASRYVEDDENVIEYVGEKVSKKRADDIYQESLDTHLKDSSKGSVYLFVLNSKYDINGDVPWNTARYINHSCEPNCYTDIVKGKIWIRALRDIEKGEELSYDYGYDLDSWEDHPCRCGSPSCVGYIVGEDDRPKLKKILERKGMSKDKSKAKNRSAKA